MDLKSLCVADEKLCWALYVDVVCLCDNGNMHDAAFLAATAALRNSKLKHLYYVGKLRERGRRRKRKEEKRERECTGGLCFFL